MLSVRNSTPMRKLFAEVACCVCFAKRKHCVEAIKVTDDDFDLDQLQSKFKAPHHEYVVDMWTEDDPVELWPAINELVYHVTQKQSRDACYWAEWILAFDGLCKQRREPIQCQRRAFPELSLSIPDKHQHEAVWLLWDVLLQYNKQKSPSSSTPLSQSYVQALLALFAHNYTPAAGKRRKLLLYTALTWLTHPHADVTGVPILTTEQHQLTQHVIHNISAIYAQIKQNQIDSNTHWLFSQRDGGNHDPDDDEDAEPPLYHTSHMLDASRQLMGGLRPTTGTPR
jgi:hypothetical protein